MDEPASPDATRMLTTLADGDADAAGDLLPIVYEELRALAGSYFRHQPADHTLQPTALVHEAFLRLINHEGARWKDRAHFLAVAATAMRQILISHARRRGAVKRGGGRARVPLDVGGGPAILPDEDLIALDDALERLREQDERKSRVVELRFFGGMTVEEIAHVCDVSKTTAENDWRLARAWLAEQLDPEPET